MPPVDGGWVSDSGKIMWDKPVLIYTFIKTELFRQSLPLLRAFLHALGKQTDQGEVVFEFDGRFYRITEFDASIH